MKIISVHLVIITEIEIRNRKGQLLPYRQKDCRQLKSTVRDKKSASAW
jgi:hypothetical protein